MKVRYSLTTGLFICLVATLLRQESLRSGGVVVLLGDSISTTRHLLSMLQDLRNPYVMKWGLWIVIAIVVPSFVLFYGFSDTPQQTQAADYLVKVKTSDGEVKLGRQELAAAKEEAALYYAGVAVRSMGVPLEYLHPIAQQIQSAVSTDMSMEFAIGQVALRDRLARQGIRISDEQVRQHLRNQGVTSANLPQILQQVSQQYNQRISEYQYAGIVRDQIRNTMAERTVDRIAKVSLLEMWLDYRLDNELLTVSYVRVPVSPSSNLSVTETQLQEKYRELVEARDPAVVDVPRRIYEYVLLQTPPPPLQTPTEEELREAYEAAEPGDDAVSTPGGARLRQILIPVPPQAPEEAIAMARTRAEATREIILAGRDFAEVADEIALQMAEEGTTPTLTGGSLPGLFTGAERERLGEEAANFIEQAGAGEVSAPVEVPGGFALLQVTERVAPTPLSFEEAQATLRVRMMMERQDQRNQLQRERQQQEFEALREAAAEHASLEAIAAALDADVRTTSPTVAETATIPGLGDLSAYRQELAALEEGQVSPVFQTRTRDSVVLRIVETIPARDLPLENVRGRIESLLRTELAAEEAEMQATVLYEAALQSEDPLTTVALTMDRQAVRPEPFRRGEIPEELKFARDAEEEFLRVRQGQTLLLGGGTPSFPTDYFVIEVEYVDEPDRNEFLAEAGQFETMLLEAKRQGYVEEFRRQANEMLPVEYAPRLLDETGRRSSAR